MNFKNRKGYLKITDINIVTTNNTYIILDAKTKDEVKSGILPTQNNVVDLTLQLDDGVYEITTNYQSVPYQFIVYYNYLEVLLMKYKTIICDCITCSNKYKSENKLFFDLISYLTNLDILCNLKSMKYLSEEHERLYKANETKKLFGKFNFDYKSTIITLFTLIYLELYFNEAEENPNDIQDINQLFEIQKIEKCLNNSGYNFTYLITLSKKYRCDEDNCDC